MCNPYATADRLPIGRPQQAQGVSMANAEWLSVAAAAERLAVSRDTVRRMIRRGTVEAQQRPIPGGHAWFIRLPEDAPLQPEQPPAALASSPPAAPDPALLERLHEMEIELTRLRAQLPEVEAHRDALAVEVERLSRQAEAGETERQRQIAAGEVERSELRQLLAREQQAHAEARSLLQALLPKLPAPGETQEAEQRPWWRFWQP